MANDNYIYKPNEHSQLNGIDGVNLDEVDLSKVDLSKLDPCNPEDYINWWAMCKQFKIDPDDPVRFPYYYIQKLYLDAGAVNVPEEKAGNNHQHGAIR